MDHPGGGVAVVAVVAGVVLGNNSKTIALAGELLGQQRYAQAVGQYEGALFIPEAETNSYIMAKGGEALNNEDYEKALKYLEIVKDEDAAKALYTRAVIDNIRYVEAKADPAAALDKLDGMEEGDQAQKDAARAEILIGLIGSDLKDNDFAAAAGWMEKLPEEEGAIQAQAAELLAKKCAELLEDGRVEDAIEVFNVLPRGESGEKDELTTKILDEIGTLVVSGEYDEAMRLLEKFDIIGNEMYVDATQLYIAYDLEAQGYLYDAYALAYELQSSPTVGAEATAMAEAMGSSDYLHEKILGVWENNEYYLDIYEDTWASNLPQGDPATSVLYFEACSVCFGVEDSYYYDEVYEVVILDDYVLGLRHVGTDELITMTRE